MRELPKDCLDVLIVGAGISGIGAAATLRKTLPHKRIAVLESRAQLGGTWDLFRYPGIRSDSDMYTLSFRDRPWRSERSIIDGPTILGYLRETAEQTGVASLIHYGIEVRAAHWSSAERCWTVLVHDREAGSDHELRCRFLHLCAGYYSYTEGHRPQFDGEESFSGQIVHPQFWPANLDYAGRRVVVIGSGATAVTLVPAMAERACLSPGCQHRSPIGSCAGSASSVVCSSMRWRSASHDRSGDVSSSWQPPSCHRATT
jgi:cyclohexanone monooxygenase